MLNNDIKTLRITLTGSKVIGADTQHAELDIQFNKVHFYEWESSNISCNSFLK